ncbi:MAG: TIGR03619 family F420-dependent LLM class oxidoreductase [Ilumatobacteraceae bacterium]
MRFAISIPQHVPDGTFNPAALRAHMRRAEELDFDGAWTSEQTLGSAPTLGPIEVLSFAAACTERIRLGCAVFVATQHNPVQLAKSISSLDQLSLGRVDVGLGIGAKRQMFTAFDVEASTVVARFNEGLKLMRALWADDRVTFPGRFWQLDNAAMEPKPFQRPGPPVWFGGSHPAALRRAVAHADGFIGAGSSTTATFIKQVETLREALTDVGREPGTLRIAKRVYVTVDDDPERARSRTAAALHDIYGQYGATDLTAVAVFGTPQTVVAGLQQIAVAGAEMIVLNPMFDDTEQMERLAADVLPHLR